MAGSTLSFVADAALVARVKDIARSDGITTSQAAARTSALGALLPSAARGTLRFLLTEGGVEAERQLAALVTKAIARVGNTVLERQLLARAQALGADPGAQSDDDLANQAVQAVESYRREQQDLAEDHYGAAPVPARH